MGGLRMPRTRRYGRRPSAKTRILVGLFHIFQAFGHLELTWDIFDFECYFSLVPVLATSFDDLQKRVEAQANQASLHQQKLKELQSQIEKLSEQHELSNASRLHRATSAQMQLTHRLLKLVQHLHLLIPALRSSSIRPEEEALRAALEEIDGEIRRPGGMSRIVGKLNELWAVVGALSAVRGGNSRLNGSADRVSWAVVDEDGLNHIVQVRMTALIRS